MSLDIYQGEEIEFGVPFKTHGVTYTNDLLEALTEYRFEGANPAFLATCTGFSQFLRNGGRAYGDMATRPGIYDIFEITTPECKDSLELVAYDKALEQYARLASQQLKRKTGEEVHCYKASIASASPQSEEYTTRGAHESYLVERTKIVDRLHLLAPFLICRQLFCGAGGYYKKRFVISPRQMFLECIYGEKSFGYWPVISLADEPWADRKYYRIHVANGEGVRSELTTFLRQSITSYVILCIQRGKIQTVPKMKDPLSTAKNISANTEGGWKIELEDGGQMDAVEYLNSYYVSPINKLFEESDVDDHDKLALRELKFILKKLSEGSYEDLDKSVEWTIKLSLMEKGIDDYFEFEGDLAESQKKEAANFQYTAVTDALFEELTEDFGIRRVVSDEGISRALLQPPKNSRGELRVTIADRFKNRVKDISWHSISIDGTIFHFEELRGWDENEIKTQISRIESHLAKGGSNVISA